MNLQHLVLHGMAIKKSGGAAEIASILGLDPAAVQGALDRLVESGRAVTVQGKYLLSPPARMALDAEYGRLYAGLREDPRFLAAYEDFERINGTLKQIITDWQTVPLGSGRVPNDHQDADYDAGIIDRLGALHERAERILTRLAEALPRLVIYRDRLLAALERAEAGETAWVSEARIESYHTLWFELHEDLLRLMGRERAE